MKGLKPQVLVSVRTPGEESNPFIELLYASMSDTVTTHWFGWRFALFGRWQILHLHWPENLFRSARGGPSALLKYGLAWALLARVRLARPPVIWTVHNETPHEPSGWWEARYLRILTRQITHRVYLTPPGEMRPNWTVIPHGTYEPIVSGIEGEPIHGRLLFAGLIRPYKGVESLIAAFADRAQPSTHLRIVGKPFSPEYEEQIRHLTSGLDNASTSFGFLSQADLAREMLDAELIVLPYKKMGNSGILLLALSLRRPVLAPRSSATEYLQAQVGEEWIALYNGEISASVLQDAQKWLESRDSSRLDLQAFAWSSISERYGELYAQSLKRVGR